MENKNSCNHRWNQSECVKCGKNRPNSNSKTPKYKIEKASSILAERIMINMFKGWR